MKLCRCPVCHSDIHLDQLLEDDAGREILTILTQLKGNNARAIVSYIALFRPEKSALSNSRALKLMQEVLALYKPSPLLAHALSETANSVMKKRRDKQNTAPLSNHNYLKQVYESAKPLFTVVRNEQNEEEIQSQAQQAKAQEDKRIDDIQYVDRFVRMGRTDIVQDTPEYQVWLKWKEEQQQ
ncbi:Uncharacterised protein [Canicola haemoglobinophilus]|uniref:Uncharacterized protein n=1 Tax=Canicola haemoglobinophilus TaxID=733 RepID=A0AB38HBR8_9PAST|nr:hypothetical protein [Canicola haemoglobinophilus]STO55342.1 Uncharacterised protein [Canicola haemoglobinophilus]STO69089.1 Uncharacterised protein [Canicola haemoglobinophilus]